MTTQRADARILIVDDEEDTALLLRDVLRKRGYHVEALLSAAECLEYMRRDPADVVISDIQMPNMSGIELCEQLYQRYPDCAPIVLTGYGRLDTAIAALRAGAWDFLTKPASGDILEIAIDRALEEFALQREVKRLITERSSEEPIEDMIGESSPMRELRRMIRRISLTDTTVLIQGESGTGKEIAAAALHRLSSTRKEQPLVAVNCGAVPANLLESELFGHVKGAFTDARSARDGLFLQAGRGTLLLDEIGEMPLDMQAKLLRVLQQRTVRPVGGDDEIPFEARIILATNRDLETEVEEGRFREDLYHRINVVTITVPPLRSRPGDVLLLANTFIQRVAARRQTFVHGLSRQAAQLLMDYDWPGNVRELESCIERATALCRGTEIDVGDLPKKVVEHQSTRLEISTSSTAELLTLDEVNQRYVRQVLAAVGGNKTRAAQILGIDRRSIYRRLEPTTPNS
ncbi:MAG: sigma-54-dependent Fis family transcriptional regulator [Kofleriaceae bacterium]|nr:sigma-54-dependent Fis family transcriptional regulator [Kofleriaceae bacterium]